MTNNQNKTNRIKKITINNMTYQQKTQFNNLNS